MRVCLTTGLPASWHPTDAPARLVLAHQARQDQNGLMAALLRTIARHPVLAFIVLGLGAGFLTAAIQPIAEADVLPYGLPLHGFLGTPRLSSPSSSSHCSSPARCSYGSTT
jgi:hypothetical protein